MRPGSNQQQKPIQQYPQQMEMMNQPMPEDMIGAIKIKDGLFIGDSFAAQVSVIHCFMLFFI